MRRSLLRMCDSIWKETERRDRVPQNTRNTDKETNAPRREGDAGRDYTYCAEKDKRKSS